jgi:hypothetical protein
MTIGDLPEQGLDLFRHEVVDLDGDALDRFRALHLRLLGSGRAAGDVHRHTDAAQLDCYRPATRTA